MTAAITSLRIYLHTLETNEPINRSEGHTEQADSERAAAAEVRQAIAALENSMPAAMSDEQKARLLNEAQETADRLNKLNAFMGGPTFPGLPRDDKDLLYEQQRTMSRYVQILGTRLERVGQQFWHI